MKLPSSWTVQRKAKIDPRWLQSVVLLGYAIVAREIFHIERPHFFMLATVAWAILLDQVIYWFYFREFRWNSSALIIGLATTILLDSKYLWFYLCAVTVSIFSKVFIKFEKRHFYNPAAFGVVVMLLFASGYGTPASRIFSGYLWPSALFWFLGLFTVIYADRTPISMAWMGGFCVFGVVRWWVFGTEFSLALGPALGPAVLLFTFHMISDPQTGPSSVRMQVLFGVAVALIDAASRLLSIPYGQFYAIILVGCFLPLIREVERERELRERASVTLQPLTEVFQ